MRAGGTAATALAGVVALVAAPESAATVRSSFAVNDPGGQGTLRVESDAASDSLVIACAGDRVLVNGTPPDSGALECRRVIRVEVAGGAGNDTIDLGAIAPAQAAGVFRGVAASALLEGGAGDDAIVGPTAGLVQIVGGAGSDRMRGGAIDTYVFGPADTIERDSIAEPASAACEPSYFDSYQPGLSYWTMPWDALDFRALAAGDAVTVDARAPGGILAIHRNRTISGSGNGIEAVSAGDGGDRIVAACMAIGGPGDDTLAGTGGDGDLVVGGEGDDRLAGSGGPDRLVGGAGSDDLDGGAGADTLVGGTGDDRLRGGGGSDTYLFGSTNPRQVDRVGEGAGSGVDVLSFDLESDSPVRVDLSTRSRVVAQAKGLEVRADPGGARFLEGVIGGQGNDRFVGHAGANHFWSGGGTDLAAGGRGNDVYHVDWTGSMPYGAYAWGEVWSGPFERGAEDGRSVWSVRETAQSRLRIDEGTRGGFDTVDLAERWMSSAVSGSRLEGQVDEGARVDLTAPIWVVQTHAVEAAVARRGDTRHLEGIRGTTYEDVLIGNAASNVLEGRYGRDLISGGRGVDTCLITRRDDVLRGCERVRSADPDR